MDTCRKKWLDVEAIGGHYSNDVTVSASAAKAMDSFLATRHLVRPN